MSKSDQESLLRESAQHRGFKLVKSRKRTPGAGDYGRFGLTDGSGKQLIGFGTDGLTATADEIQSYLRRGDIETWTVSAKTTRANRKPTEKKQAERKPEPRARPARDADISARRTPRLPSGRKTKIVVASTPTERVQPQPQLKIRKATMADAPAIATLLNQLSNAEGGVDEVASRLAARRSNAEAMVADHGSVVGCIAWTIVPTLHGGVLGRITAIVVAEEMRRRGIGRQLLDAATAKLAEHGCRTVEVMSDIEVRNSHNFFRHLDFEQTSYRFARALKSDPQG